MGSDFASALVCPCVTLERAVVGDCVQGDEDRRRTRKFVFSLVVGFCSDATATASHKALSAAFVRRVSFAVCLCLPLVRVRFLSLSLSLYLTTLSRSVRSPLQVRSRAEPPSTRIRLSV